MLFARRIKREKQGKTGRIGAKPGTLHFDTASDLRLFCQNVQKQIPNGILRVTSQRFDIALIDQTAAHRGMAAAASDIRQRLMQQVSGMDIRILVLV